MQIIPDNYFRLLDRSEVFPDPARPIEIDVGCGDGGFLLAMARHFAQTDFLGIERLLGRVAKVCRCAAREGLGNVRVLRMESSYALGWMLPSGCATRMHLLFPDPWPKKRHARHRFINDESVAAIHRVLAPGGEFLFKTDHEEYFHSACQTIGDSGRLEALPWLPEGTFYPLTDFERQWLAEGKPIRAARWRKPH
jgi:tRNA (guanine-N7-)-methyltransferase